MSDCAAAAATISHSQHADAAPRISPHPRTTALGHQPRNSALATTQTTTRHDTTTPPEATRRVRKFVGKVGDVYVLRSAAKIRRARTRGSDWLRSDLERQRRPAQVEWPACGNVTSLHNTSPIKLNFDIKGVVGACLDSIHDTSKYNIFATIKPRTYQHQ